MSQGLEFKLEPSSLPASVSMSSSDVESGEERARNISFLKFILGEDFFLPEEVNSSELIRLALQKMIEVHRRVMDLALVRGLNPLQSTDRFKIIRFLDPNDEKYPETRLRVHLAPTFFRGAVNEALASLDSKLFLVK